MGVGLGFKASWSRSLWIPLLRERLVFVSPADIQLPLGL